MSAELAGLTAAEAAARVAAGDVSPAELFDAYRDRAAAAALNATTWTA